MEKNPELRSRMNIPDLIFETLVSVFWVKNTLKFLKFFEADPDPGSCQPWIRDGKNQIGDRGSWIRDNIRGSAPLYSDTVVKKSKPRKQC